MLAWGKDIVEKSWWNELKCGVFQVYFPSVSQFLNRVNFFYAFKYILSYILLDFTSSRVNQLEKGHYQYNRH